MIQSKQIPREHETIELAWCDKTSFEDIFNITGLREPDVIRVTPHPLFNTYTELFNFTQILKESLNDK